MYTEQHKMHNCSDIIKLSNLIKSQLGAATAKTGIIFTGRRSSLCLVNTLTPERFLRTQSWEPTEKLQAHFSSVWHRHQQQKTTEICSHYVCFQIATQALTHKKMMKD